MFHQYGKMSEKSRKNRRIKVASSVLFLLAAQFIGSSVYGFSEGFYLEVPYIHQADNYCGPAALAMVFRYWKHPGNQHEIAGNFVPFPDKGLSGEQLKQTVTAGGLRAYSFKGKRSDLIKHLRKGRPLIVALDPSFPSSTNHYIVLVGWISASEKWIVHDPASGSYLKCDAEKLEARWNKLGNWTLLVMPGNEE